MFEGLSTKLKSAKIVISWVPDADFLPAGVTFANPAVSISIHRSSPVRDDNPDSMLSGSPQLSEDSRSVQQLIVGGVSGAKYVLEYLADFSDGIQRDGVRALLEVE